MSMRLAAASASRPARLQRLLAAAPGPAAACGGLAELPVRRCFAAGRGFEGFFGGGGFPGGSQRGPPPRQDDKFYSLLGISRGASEAEIKKAYKEQAMKHHPDRGGDESTFKEISRAYEVLSDGNKRQIYDQYGEDGLNNMEQGSGAGGPAADPFDLFSQIFGFNAAGSRPRGKPRTPDQAYDLQLTLEELYSGTSRNVVFNRSAICKPCNGMGGHDRKTCSRCKGTGVVVTMQQVGPFVQQLQSPCGACGSKGYTIPPGSTCGSCHGKGLQKEKKPFDVEVERGTAEGAEFRFKGQADEEPGHDTGDVVIVVRTRPHKTFQRVGEHLLMSKKISLQEALCGFQFSTTFLDGEELVVRAEQGQVIQPGDITVVEGKGMPRGNGQRPGNLFVMLTVDFPDSIPPEAQEQLLQALGGKPLPPLQEGSAPTRKLTRRESEVLKQKVEKEREFRQAGRGNNETTCHQM